MSTFTLSCIERSQSSGRWGMLPTVLFTHAEGVYRGGKIIGLICSSLFAPVKERKFRWEVEKCKMAFFTSLRALLALFFGPQQIMPLMENGVPRLRIPSSSPFSTPLSYSSCSSDDDDDDEEDPPLFPHRHMVINEKGEALNFPPVSPVLTEKRSPLSSRSTPSTIRKNASVETFSTDTTDSSFVIVTPPKSPLSPE